MKFIQRRLSERERVADVLRHLDQSLEAELRAQIRHRRPRLRTGDLTEEAFDCVCAMWNLRSQLSKLADATRLSSLTAHAEINAMAAATARLLADTSGHPIAGRSSMIRVLGFLAATDAQLELPNTSVHRVIVHTDVLSQLHHSLMPAERMAIVSGYREGDALRLGAAFDVTDQACANRVHVRAEPARLGQALLKMERCGSRLVAWAHSHPGIGPGATTPSQIDRRQWAQWAEDIPLLVAIILTVDGTCRFWGGTVEQHALKIEIEGHGLRRLGPYVYQLD